MKKKDGGATPVSVCVCVCIYVYTFLLVSFPGKEPGNKANVSVYIYVCL